MPQGDYSAIEKGWDGLPWDEQRDIINTALSGEARPDDFEKDFDQLKSEIPDFESGVANYLGIDEGESNWDKSMGQVNNDISKNFYDDEDMDDPDEDLVIIGSGYLDIKSNFGERPSQTNGEYAEIGQKVVDQLHNGDKDAALDFIYSKINEGSCGYSQEAPGGKDLKTPGGTKGIPADKRTMGMMRETIRKEIKKLSEEGSLDKNLKGEFSPEEWEKITSKKVPSFADMKPKDDREGPDHGKTQTSPSGTKFRKWDKKTDMMGNPRGTKRKDKNMQGGPLRKGNVNYRDNELK